MTTRTRRGTLRLYLGAAPGVGKTYAMLDEGRRRAHRGTDVVVAVAESHGRAPVEELLAGLERVGDGPAGGAGQMDVEAVLARRPQVALVDEFAHRNPPGAPNGSRWQDVEELLDAGIDVVSTVGIEQLESLTDAVRGVLGVRPSETVPDAAVRRAQQIELVDMTPEALRRRMAHGNIYPADRLDTALTRYFRPGNLAALREMALLWLADRVDESLEQYREGHGVAAAWPARQRVVVAVSGGPESETLLRRGARLASRGAGGELHAVHVSRPDRRSGAEPGHLAQARLVTEGLGGTHHTVAGDDPAAAVLAFARGVNATEVIVGAGHDRPLASLFRRSVGARIIEGSGEIDVLVVTRPGARRRLPHALRTADLGRTRTVAGWAVAVLGPVALTALLVPMGGRFTAPFEALSFLALTVACALVGGLWPALCSVLVGTALLNYFFTPPLHTFAIADAGDVVTLVLFLAVAAGVASVVDTAARRSVQAGAARREADTLSMLNRTLLGSGHGVQAMLDLVCETFGAGSASLLRHEEGGTGWSVAASRGDDAPSRPEDADAVAEVSPALRLALHGRVMPPQDLRVLAAFATHLSVVLEREELESRAAEARRLEEGNRMRTALLAAVSHDLRTPLAGIKAAVTTLRTPGMRWSARDQDDLLGAIEDSADRLDAIVANLLDMSRLQTGAVHLVLQEVGLEDVLASALVGVVDAAAVDLDLPTDLPAVRVDVGLLDRVVANLVQNAVRHSPAGSRARVAAGAVADRVQLRVVDHGPGVPEDRKPDLFQPFQRLGDGHVAEGVGLGLAVAKGLTEAMGGELVAEDTPGGGLTMIVDLPGVPVGRAPAEALRDEVARP